MTSSNTVLIEAPDEDGVALVTLNRPEALNAADEELHGAVAGVWADVARLPGVHAVVLTGAGTAFSAGGDLNWMRSMASYGEKENVEDALKLAELMEVLDTLSKPTIAKVNGPAYGGGVGLVACCDIAICTEAAKFALTGFTEGLRTELARENILVTGIYPSTMRTGGHTHAWFKGKREAEYTWFALSDSIPILSTSAAHVARRLWRGVCNGDAEVIVGWPTHLIVVLQALFPNEVAEVMALADRLLPGPADLGAPAVQGQDLRGTVADLLNRAIPAGTRPGMA